ncbi:tRNA (guanosine(37)-N1)-methyltransferase TrmD [Candidatus Dependentiae bacterium]|nr:tRNA (guanosine(37)-N1)-methyltransferase TrmD [Candidatus Dependentiae bacterium]
MITISIITVFPELHESFISLSLLGKAQEKGLLKINLIRFSDFVAPKERIDQQLCGPGAGMMLKPEVVEKAINHCIDTHGDGFKIFFSPQGTVMTQPVVKLLAEELFDSPSTDTQQPALLNHAHIILVCPRYEGMDARVEQEYADTVISIGDYVLMGGDLPAQVLLEALLRYAPGIVGNAESVEADSFTGPLLDHPAYTLPVTWHEQEIPPIIRSGNHEAIAQWRREQACKKTILQRFDWFRAAQPSKELCNEAKKTIPPHYVVLMHDQVKLADGSIGTSSVTSIDIHDTARSCATYGIQNFFLVTPLVDQLSIVETFLNFWHSERGKKYNPSRFKAVSRVRTEISLARVLTSIEAETGKKPLVITTSAKIMSHATTIDYHSQGTVWAHNRPIVFIFGTAQGLADEVVNQSDYLLLPITGMTDYNHLSVRSAMAIILDRWLGLQPKLPKKLPH